MSARVPLRVAAVQYTPSRGDVSRNIEQTAALVERAIAQGARVIVFPELSLTGYDLALLGDDEQWFMVDDPRLDAIREVAAAANAAVVVGAPVVSGSERFIASLVLTGTASDVLAPKTHLHGAEKTVVQPGSGPVTMSFADRTLAFAVCFDTGFPDHAAIAKSAGAEVYIASVLYTAGEERKQDVRMAARAIDNSMWVVSANLGGYPVGERSAGGTGIWAPTGETVAFAQGRDEEIVIAILDEAEKG